MEKRVTSAFGWKFFERISVQGTNFLVTLLLARLLTPSDYGTVSVVTIFIALATTFVQGGFNTALIQKKDVDGNDYLTILMFSEIVAAALYLVIFFTAPFISNIYHTPELSSLLRVMAIVLFPGAFNAVQVAYVTRDLRVILAALFSREWGSTGIWLAWPVGWTIGTTLSVILYQSTVKKLKSANKKNEIEKIKI